MGLSGTGPVERIHEDLAGTASRRVEPTGVASACPAGERRVEAGADRGVRSRAARVRYRDALARGRREPGHDDGTGVRARTAFRHQPRPRHPAGGDRGLDEVSDERSEALPIEEGTLAMKTT